MAKQCYTFFSLRLHFGRKKERKGIRGDDITTKFSLRSNPRDGRQSRHPLGAYRTQLCRRKYRRQSPTHFVRDKRRKRRLPALKTTW